MIRILIAQVAAVSALAMESEHGHLKPQKGRACPARTIEVLDLLVKGGAWESNGLKQ